MKIETTKNGTEMTVRLEGRLDASTAPELSQELRANYDDITDLTLDLEGLEYISSAGLRVLLEAHKTMSGKGTMTVLNVNGVLREIFEATGFSNILNIQ